MTPRWYVETLVLGRWAPSLYFGDRPDPRGPEGKRMKFRADPVLIPPEYEGLSLELISRILGPDGDLAKIPRAELLAFLEDPTKSVLFWNSGETTQ